MTKAATAQSRTRPPASPPPVEPLRPSLSPQRVGSVANDMAASVVVFLVALPLCLGIALASGAPLKAGIVAGVVGGLIVAPISGSALQVSGPAAGLTAIVLAAISELGAFPPFLTAVALAGLIQIGLGLLRAGAIGFYFPSTVIKGMLAAIGIILILKQLPHAVGWDANVMFDEAFRQRNRRTTLSGLADAARNLAPVAILISSCSLALLFWWPRKAVGRLKLVPAPLLVVLLGVAVNFLFRFAWPEYALGPAHLVALPVTASLQDAAGFLAFPAWSAVTDLNVLRIAITIAIVASLETLLSLEATDKLDPYKRVSPPNRELLAQGVGNTICGLIGGLPLTGVVVRSSVNVNAGGRTKLSAILHAVWLLVAVMAIPALLNKIPLAALAAILIYTGIRLAHPLMFKWVWKDGLESFLPFMVTVVAIVATDLLVGIGIGMAVGFGFILREHLRSPGFRIVSTPGAVLTRLALDDQVTFLNKGSLSQTLQLLPPGSRIEIDGRRSRRIHRDVLELLHDFQREAQVRQIDYRLVGVPSPGAADPTGH